MALAVVAHPIVLGTEIRAARRARGLTQAALANAVGTYPRAIIDIERGRAGADLALLLAVLDKVGLRLSVEAV